MRFLRKTVSCEYECNLNRLSFVYIVRNTVFLFFVLLFLFFMKKLRSLLGMSCMLLLTITMGNIAAAQEEGEMCVQMTQAAMNEDGVCATFSTPCDVPEGWTMVDSCDMSEEDMTDEEEMDDETTEEEDMDEEEMDDEMMEEEDMDDDMMEEDELTDLEEGDFLYTPRQMVYLRRVCSFNRERCATAKERIQEVYQKRMEWCEANETLCDRWKERRAELMAEQQERMEMREELADRIIYEKPEMHAEEDTDMEMEMEEEEPEPKYTWDEETAGTISLTSSYDQISRNRTCSRYPEKAECQ